jgi:hypothetical protein
MFLTVTILDLAVHLSSDSVSINVQLSDGDKADIVSPVLRVYAFPTPSKFDESRQFIFTFTNTKNGNGDGHFHFLSKLVSSGLANFVIARTQGQPTNAQFDGTLL